jgi:hypothetical protein
VTVLLIAAGITATVLMAALAYVTGALVGTRKGVDIGFGLASDLFEDGTEEDPYFQHYGGQIDAGRRGEN